MRARTRKKIRVFLFSVLLLLMSVYLARNLLISQHRIKEQAQRELETMFPGFAVSFESAEPSGVKSIRAERVTVYPIDQPEDHIFHARRVTIVPRALDLLRGEFRTEEIVFESPTFFVGETGFSNVTRVLKAMARSRLRSRQDLVLVPKVDLRNASLSIPGLRNVPFVNLHLRLIDTDSGVYDISGTVSDSQQAVFNKFTWAIAGRYDATSGVLNIGIDAPGIDLADNDFREGVAWVLDLLAQQPDADPFTKHLAAEIYTRYDAEGRMDAHLDVSFYQQENRSAFELTMDFAGATRLTLADIPEQVHVNSGSLVLTDVGMLAENLRGAYRGGSFTMNGRLDRRFVDANNRLVLHLQGLTVDKTLTDKLSEGPARRFLEDCSLSGSVDVTATLYRHPGEELPRSRFEVTGGSLVGTFLEFPYPVYLRSGSIDWIGDCLTLSDMQLMAVHTDVRAELSGTISELGMRCPRTELNVVGKDLPLDEHLRKAVHPKVRKVMERMQLTGRTDFDCVLRREPGEKTPIRMDFDLAMHDVGAAPKDMPLTFEKFDGRLVGGPETFRMEAFVGRTGGGGHVAFDGKVVNLETTPEMTAEFTARGVGLQEALKLARSEKGFDIDEVVKKAEGRLDLMGSLAIIGADDPEDEKWDVDTAIRLEDGVLAAGPFPYEWTDVRGLMAMRYVRGGKSTLKIETLTGRGQHPGSTMGLTGKVDYGQGKSWVDLDFDVTDLPLDEKVTGALPPEARELVKTFRPEGRFDASVKLGKSASDRYTFEARIRLKEVAEKRMKTIGSAEGLIEVTGARDGETLELTGELKLDSVTVVRKKIRNLQGSFAVSDNVLSLYRLRGEMYDGRFGGSARIGLDARMEYSLSAKVAGVNMNKFVTDIVPDYDGAPLGGLLTGSFKVQGHGTDTKHMVGQGEFALKGGKIMKFPLALKLMNLLRLSIPADDDFLEAMVKYNVVDNTIRLDAIEVGCPSMTVHGRGSISSTGKLDLKFTMGSARYGIPIVTQVIEAVSNPLMQVQVSGKIKDPKLDVDPIAPITAPLRALLGLFAER